MILAMSQNMCYFMKPAHFISILTAKTAQIMGTSGKASRL